jgi:hypothetical protein
MAEHPTAFAPVDITDGRNEGSWQTRYPCKAWIFIIAECVYLLFLLILAPTAIAYSCTDKPEKLFGVNESLYLLARPGICAWFGGMLGGVLFDLKWLYHSVAKQIWNVDRILWRVTIPHLSAGLAFGTILLMRSGVLRIFDATAIDTPRLSVSIAFLVGYFSDMAAAKLAEVAKTLFGPTKDSEPHPAGHMTPGSTAHGAPESPSGGGVKVETGTQA